MSTSGSTFSWGSRYSDSNGPSSTPQSPLHSGSASSCEPEGAIEGATPSCVIEAYTVPTLWFQDGTVVLQAGSSLFKLHQSILTLRSPVFDRILNWQHSDSELSVSVERGSTFEGYSVLKLSDHGQDANYFFLALYDSGFFERPPAQTSYEVVLAILSLSTKYEVAYLRKRAHTHLLLSYPLTLTQWDQRQNISTLAAELDTGVDARPGSVSKTLKVIDIAKSLDIPWILPAVFYDCSSFSLELLLNDSWWNNGTIDDQTKKTILIGHHKQTAATHSQMLKFLYCEPLERCTRKSICSETRRKLYSASQEWVTTKPLEIMDEGDWDCFLGDLCELCLDVSKVRFEQARNEFWASLPEMYGLPGWDVLVGLCEDAVEDAQAMHL